MATDAEYDASESATTKDLRREFEAAKPVPAEISRWLLGAGMAVLFLVGLILLSRAQDIGMTIVALLMVGVGLVSIFRMIHLATAAPKH